MEGDMKAQESSTNNLRQGGNSVRGTAALQTNEFVDDRPTFRTYQNAIQNQQAQSWHVRNPLEYINPAVFNQRLGPIPFIMGGALQEKPSWEEQYKTVMCEAWLTDGQCYYGDTCRFAHGENELRPMTRKPIPRNTRKLKTKLCDKYTKNGICPYGDNCFFVHPDPSNPFNQEFFNLSQVFNKYQQEILNHELNGSSGYSYPMNNSRLGFSASVPDALRLLNGQSNLARNLTHPLNNVALLNLAQSLHPHLSLIPEKEPLPSTSSKSASINESHSPPLREQILERLRLQESRQVKRDYDPLVGGFEISQFSQSLKSQNSPGFFKK